MEGSNLLTLSVPAEQAPRLSDALRELWRTKTGSSRFQPEATPADGDETLNWLERLVATLDAVTRPGETVDLRGPREFLREGLLVAIDELGDGLSERCTDLLRGSGSPAKIRADARGLDELVGLLDNVEQAAR